jgi:hypothetical protein
MCLTPKFIPMPIITKHWNENKEKWKTEKLRVVEGKNKEFSEFSAS